MVISEITEEKDDDYSSSIDVEAQKTRIRQILKNQKYNLNLSTSSLSSSSAGAASNSSGFASSGRISKTLMELMRGGSCSLRRLFEMEHTSLGSFFNDYSGSPLIKPILLWDSDDDQDCQLGRDRDPWAMIIKNNDVDVNLPRGFASARRSFSDGDDDGERDNKTRVLTRSRRSGRRKLSRKKSFRKLPGFGLRRWRVFRLIRRLKIMTCGRIF